MTRKEAIDIIEKEIHIDVRHCTQEDVNRFAVALRMAIAVLREQDVKYTNVRTNADHIRSMADEELANTIHAVSLGWRGRTNWCDFHCENPGEDGCDKCILLWLKQPYKEDT